MRRLLASVPDAHRNAVDRPAPALKGNDPDHPCPRCGVPSLAPMDGSARSCVECGHEWMLGTIDWVDVSALESGQGHGVEIWYGPVGGAGEIVAFIDGFDWLRHPGNPATVTMLDSRPPAVPSSEWPAVAARVRVLSEGMIRSGGTKEYPLVGEEGQLHWGTNA